MENKSRYELKPIVCDYGIFENEKLILLLTQYGNAKKILEILKSDEQMKLHKKDID